MEDDSKQAVAESLGQARVSLTSIAHTAGLSYATLHAWWKGRRNPTPEGLARVAQALECKSGELTELARRLREVGSRA
jgi:transcriptional regulator with XRE-family HTH domain